MTDAPYEPRRFRTTVPFYERFRLGYPERLIARVGRIVGLAPGEGMVDLGCGPGTLAVPFARAGAKVTAVDPEPAMLEAAREAAERAGVALTLLRGSSFDLPDGVGPFRLVTMGRSFHWMDRAATLEILDRLVVPGGAIALFDDDHPRTVENRWRRSLEEVGRKYGRAEELHIIARDSEAYRTHESYLLASAFDDVGRTSVIVQRRLTADGVLGLAYSLSTSSPERLGARKDAFEADLRAALAALSPDGQFTEIAEMSALIARHG
jgi:SAM-dependent methyltransferase